MRFWEYNEIIILTSGDRLWTPHFKRTASTLTQNGTLTLDHLPFQAGETVEVIVLPNALQTSPRERYSLRGTPVAYQAPMDPVAKPDWESLS